MELHEVKITGLGRSSEVELIPIGDIHLGTINCDLDELRRTIKYVESNPSAYWLGMGDFCECIRHQDHRRFDPRTIPPRHLARLGDIAASEREELEEILFPILNDKKCWGLHGGNHEEDLYKYYGEDIIGQLCRAYGLRDLGYQALTRVRFSRSSSGNIKTYVIHSQHGHGGGRKVGAKLNLLRDLPANINADVHIMGHVHDRIIDDAVQLELSSDSLRLEAREKVFGITGTFYRTYQEGITNYAEKRNYPPTPIGCIKITFAPWSNRHKLHIEKLRA